MKTILSAALALAAHAAVAAPATLRISGAWSRPAAAGTNGAGYLTVANAGRTPETLIGAESPLARKVEVHQTSMEGGVMRMSRPEGGIRIEPGGSALFSPGGDHLMIFGLKQALKAGDRLPVTLVFSGGRRMPVELAVGTGAPAAHPAH